MSLINDWIKASRYLLTETEDFLSSEARRDSFEFPLRFALISAILTVIASIVSIAVSVTFTILSGENRMLLTILSGIETTRLILIAISPIIGVLTILLALLLFSGFVHVIVYVIGGRSGYKNTLAALCYSTAPLPLSAAASMIPLAGSLASIVISMYGLYIQVKGLESFQDLTTARAALSVILPILTIAVALILLILLAFFIVASGVDGY